MRWEIAELGECNIVIGDGNYSSKYPKPSEFQETGIPFITSSDLKNGRIISTNFRFISPELHNKLQKGHLKTGDVLVVTRGNGIGITALVSEEYDNANINAQLVLLRCDETRIHNKFLYYYLSSLEVYKSFRQIGSGSAQPQIPIKSLIHVPIRVPPFLIQKKIAIILSAYDDLIENNLRRIELLEKAARELYQEWFIRFKFPGYEKVKFKDGLPEGWERKPVPSVIQIDPRTPVPRDRMNKFVPMASLANNSMVIDPIEEKSGNSGSKFRNHDTLFARITPCLENGKTGFVDFLNDESGFGSTEFIVLRGSKVPPEFVYCLARTYDFRQKAIKSMIGSSGRQRVQSTCFNDFLIPLPNPDILKGFTSQVRPMFNQISLLNAKTRLLKQARDLLLPRLMKGEIEVSA